LVSLEVELGVELVKSPTSTYLQTI
jgi:hypothetical protein